MFLPRWRRFGIRQSQSSRKSNRGLSGSRFCRPRIDVLEDRLLLSIFTVTNTNDSGSGSFRQAILDANDNPGTNTIAFNIGGGGGQTIRPLSALPTITNHVVIDGTTQPGFSGAPLIVVNGSMGGPRVSGLRITAGYSTVQGLVINGFGGIEGFDGDGIVLQGGGNNVITGNYIGTDPTGTMPVGNAVGISILSNNNLIGGSAPANRNLISGNTARAIHISVGSGNLVQGNYIGTDATGTVALANSEGVRISDSNNTIGGTVQGTRNLLSGNITDGLVIFGNNNIVQGNYIGTDVNGTNALGNAEGMGIYGMANTVGGILAGAGNLISANRNGGIQDYGIGSIIQGNFIGTDVTGTHPLGNALGVGIGLGVLGGTIPGARNLISGNRSAGIGLRGDGYALVVKGNYIGTDVTGTRALGNFDGILLSPGSGDFTIGGTEPGAGNLISGNLDNGIVFYGDRCKVEGNFIGTNGEGTAPLGNFGAGIASSGFRNVIGGTANGAGNLISGNKRAGVLISGISPSITASENRIEGNYIGTNAAGTTALSNGGVGVAVEGGAYDNTIGGIGPGARNIISGNSAQGVRVFKTDGNNTRHNFIQGNYIGTNAAGTASLGNQMGGIFVPFSQDNLVSGNLVSGNGGFAGIVVCAQSPCEGLTSTVGDASGNMFVNNKIGTDVNGTAAVGNLGYGILVDSGRGIVIGGTSADNRNIISGNLRHGIILYDPVTACVVQGNFIGTDVNGSARLPNMVGVYINGSNNTIGGTISGTGNVISGNLDFGLAVGGNNNLVLGNLIGTGATGTSVLGNSGGGLAVGGFNNIVGGTTIAARNVISGNQMLGVFMSGSNDKLVGNYIGTDIRGNTPLGNSAEISVFLVGNGNTVGGSVPGAGNLVSGNRGDGIFVRSDVNQVQGNLIGTDAGGTRDLGNGGNGVTIKGSSNLIGGTALEARNIISGNGGAGIVITSDGLSDRNQVQGNFIGTDITGTQVLPNDSGGLRIIGGTRDNTIGGTATGVRNLISGNRGDGLDINGDHEYIQGNYVGTDVTGTRTLPNTANGISIAGAFAITIGGTVPGAGNLISGNGAAGVSILPGFGENLVQGNTIGTNVSGTEALGNADVGVAITGSDTIIGGATPGAGNLISGNRNSGVSITSARNQVQGNFIGTDVTGTIALGNQTGISITGSDNTIGGTTAGARNIISGYSQTYGVMISGNSATGNLLQGNFIGTDVSGTIALGNFFGVYILNGPHNNTIGGSAAGAGNLISGNNGSGVFLSGGGTTQNLLQGNYIGVDVSGTMALGNQSGIYLAAPNNTIGGPIVGARNIISGNSQESISLSGENATDNLVQGNYIGTDVTGTIALPEDPLGNGSGILFFPGANNNTLGGITPGSGNVISGHPKYGVWIFGATGNRIQGNYIGTDASGTKALGNGMDGINMGSVTNTLIGGTTTSTRNVISGNGGFGIYMARGDSTLVQGNYIGTDTSGVSALGNALGGVAIYITSGATIGGTTAGAGNLISGNLGDGVAIFSPGNLVQGNDIGTDATGTAPLGNQTGVSITGPDNTVGGTVPGAGNTIAFNGRDGVLVSFWTGNAILRNRIFGHDNGLGIHLVNHGNHDQEFPTLTSAFSASGITTISGTLTSAPSTTYTVELFVNSVCNPSGFGEGERFLASLTVSTDSDGNADFTFTLALTIDPGQFIASTATDPGHNTSQFSPCMEVTGPNGPGNIGFRPPKNVFPESCLQPLESSPRISSETFDFEAPALIQSTMAFDVSEPSLSRRAPVSRAGGIICAGSRGQMNPKNGGVIILAAMGRDVGIDFARASAGVVE